METVTKAKRWIGERGEVRIYIETMGDDGKAHQYTRYITGNPWHQPKTWGDDNGAEGTPSRDVAQQYRELTENGRRSYYAPEPIANPDRPLTTCPDCGNPDCRGGRCGIYDHESAKRR